MTSRGNTRVKFNVRGEIFETYASTLRRFPDTLLGKLDKQSDLYSVQTAQYVFNRSKQCFGAILYYHQTNILSCPDDIPIKAFIEECEYFELSTSIIEETKVKGGILKDLEEKEEEEEEVDKSLRARAWDILENPETSFAARVFAIFSLSVILLSIFTACLETVSVLEVDKNTDWSYWSYLELATNCWFLLELVLRFVASPEKCKFLTDFFNWIDGIVVIPYFILLVTHSGRVKSLGFLRCFRFIRVLRLFRLSKHNKRIRIFQEVMKSSVGDFQMLFVCVFIETTLVGSIMYLLEKKENAQFDSIPESMWWCIITLTTVGYGDITPITWSGKVFSAAFIVFGALTMTLPICSVCNTFIKVYLANTENNKFVS